MQNMPWWFVESFKMLNGAQLRALTGYFDTSSPQEVLNAMKEVVEWAKKVE